ncbi:hypothetical protein O6H91_06G046400 [Diphasiastrum complanatum]|uniref:Uncharacterized protein n=1 Tax=Diphasiastrum complanatum TaxID=34168 RepID=A0ACC2DDD7_DIPCM|nr:hypothetical protein O6H91_06G046400 [Diphasiastrum complanatum]
MGFPIIQVGLLPFWFITSSISLDGIRNAVFSVLEIVGIDLRHAETPVQRRDSVRGNSIEAEHGPSSGTWDHFRGLPDEIRDSLSVVPIESVADNLCCEEDAICAVCLCEYEKEDPVWSLPSCSHIFHKRCLDRWLDQNQTTCPTCRGSLLTEELAQKHKRREEELIAELALWFSFYHGSTSMRSPWYRRHGFPHWVH